uniref:GATA-type domain-containing protein n=1 Tax=Syphacia muris TaxID=451379 RepID=A0A0N5AKU8_9BILA
MQQPMYPTPFTPSAQNPSEHYQFASTSNAVFLPPNQSCQRKPNLNCFAEENLRRVKSHANSVCANCHVRETTLWRRRSDGLTECNACNLYFRKNGRLRPASYNKGIRRRARVKNKVKQQ